MKYRPEIDGLRAIAVVPVILYHADVPSFSGGFTGVDVFFVISGFLITGILVGDLDAGRYSIARFYERRARRILPALFALLVATTVAAWFILIPSEFGAYADSVVAVLAFCSNVLFWQSESYFALGAHFKPLQHTWTLAVEEQFYLFFPLLLAACRNLPRKTIARLIVAACVASFALCEFASRLTPTANFYLLPTRAWELLAGSACVFAGRRHFATYSSWFTAAGLAAIVFGIAWLSPAVPFPSHYALLPVAGTAAVLVFGDAQRGVGRLLASAPLVGIGLISYSLYLWHQPLFAFARVLEMRPLGVELTLGLIAASFVLAALSWRFVEQPFRKRTGRPSFKLTAGLAAGCTGLFAATAAYAWITDGAVGRMGPANPAALRFAQAARFNPPLPQQCRQTGSEDDIAPCWYAGATTAKRRVAVFGDSHARSIMAALPESARLSGTAVLFGTASGCPSLIGGYVLNGNGPARRCAQIAAAQFSAAREARVSALYLVNRWQLYSEGDPFLPSRHYLLSTKSANPRASRETSRVALELLLKHTIAAYRAAGIEVILVHQVPEQEYSVDRLLDRLPYAKDGTSLASVIPGYSVTRAHAEARYAATRRILGETGALSIDPRPLFASGQLYLWGDRAGSWYRDNSHLSSAGARRLVPLLATSLGAVGDGQGLPMPLRSPQAGARALGPAAGGGDGRR